MTSQMNFGPEWMRGGEVLKRNSRLDDTSSSNNNQQYHHLIQNHNDDNSFKYSKEYMLSLYKSVDLPANINPHEYAISAQDQTPLSLLEDKYLDNDTTMNKLNFKSDKGHTFENLDFNDNDNFKFGNNFRRGSELLEEELPIWSGADKDNVGTFDSNGVFLLGAGGDSNLGDTSLESSLEHEETADDINFDFRDSSDIQLNSNNVQQQQFRNDSRLMTPATPDKSNRWVYRNPSCHIQGPFTSLEMQGWFEAGFFDHSLNVKRQDAPFFESLSTLMQKVPNAEIPFMSSTWPKNQPSAHYQRQQSSNVECERAAQASLLPKTTTNKFASASLLFDNGFGNHALQHMNNNLEAFNSNFEARRKSSLNVSQSPFGNTPFVTTATPLPRLNPTNTMNTLYSPWEYDDTPQNGSSSSWLRNQNDRFHDGIISQQQSQPSRSLQQHQKVLFYDGTEDDFGAGGGTITDHHDYQQQAMSQQIMQQQYLTMLRQNQQQHIQLQQRMLQEQQQQQQLLLQQQRRQQQEQNFMNNNQNYDQQQQQQRNTAAPPPPPLSLHRPFMNRAWTSVPNTPGFIEPLQNPWNTSNFSNEPFNHNTFQPPPPPPPQSVSPPTNVNVIESQQHSKTLIEEPITTTDQLAQILKEMSINETKPAFVEEPESIEQPSKQRSPSPSKQEEPEKQELKQDGSTPSEPAWGSTDTKKKTLREIQREEEASSSKKMPQVRSNTWSAVSFAAHKPTQQQKVAPVISPSFSTNTRNHQAINKSTRSTWDAAPPVRQKRVSINDSIPPSTTKSSALPRTQHTSSRPPTIKSEPKKPSPDFLVWCKLSLRGLNPGVKADEILQMLLSFPIDNSYSEIIQDIIYANSSSMNGSRFANDFITRRRADLDGKFNVVLPKASSVYNNGSSEFKVVTAKKGKKKQHH